MSIRSQKQKHRKEYSVPEPHSVKLHLINICLLTLIGIILYASSLNAPFIFDDIPNILEPSWIKTPENFLSHYFKNGSFYKHRIIPSSTFALNWHFNRDNSFGYHIVNVVIHILNSFLIYFITLKLLSVKANNFDKESFAFLEVSIKNERERVILSLAVALLFISHPVQTNTVIYIVQRNGEIMAFFYLLSFYLFIQAVHLLGRSLKKALLYIGSFFTFILAIWSKEVAITLPLMIAIYCWIFGIKRDKISLKRSMLIVLSTGSIIGLASYALFSSGVHTSFPHWSGPHLNFRWGIKENLYTQANVIIEYVKLLILPLPSKLNIDHYFPLYNSIFQFPTYLSLPTILVVNLFALIKAKRFPHFCFCILWWFVTLIPSSSIWPIWDIMVEYRVYLPGFGFYLLLVLGIHQVFSYLAHVRHWLESKYIVGEIVLVILLTLSYLWGTYERSLIWNDEVSLWADAVKKSPHKTRPHNGLGVAYRKKGMINEALSEFKKAIAIKPSYANHQVSYANAHLNLGITYYDEEMLDEAISEYKKALTIYPNHIKAHSSLGLAYYKKGMINEAISEYKKVLAIDPHYTDIHYNLAIAYEDRGMLDEAISQYKKSLAINPNDAEAHNNLGLVYGKKGMVSDAIIEYKKAIEIDPTLPEPHRNLGLVYGRKGIHREAIFHLRRALTMKTDDAVVYNNLAWIYATSPDETLRDGEAAVSLATKACEVTKFNNVIFLSTLAAAYAEAGNFKKAIEYQRKIIDLSRKEAKPALLKRLELYKSEKAYREKF